MVNSDLMARLNHEVDSFPARASGEDLYEHLGKVLAVAVNEDRQGAVAVMLRWLQLRSEPKTMLAVDLAGKYRVYELKDELESLLLDVLAGKVFKPFYERPIRKSLAMI